MDAYSPQIDLIWRLMQYNTAIESCAISYLSNTEWRKQNGLPIYDHHTTLHYTAPNQNK